MWREVGCGCVEGRWGVSVWKEGGVGCGGKVGWGG